MKLLRDWKSRRREKAEGELFEDVLDDAFGRPSYRHIRQWNLQELHQRLATNDLHPAERRMAESQVRIKEAWYGPAGRAIRLSRYALAVSILAIVVSAWAALRTTAG
jgi:hypothetical protein